MSQQWSSSSLLLQLTREWRAICLYMTHETRATLCHVHHIMCRHRQFSTAHLVLAYYFIADGGPLTFENMQGNTDDYSEDAPKIDIFYEAMHHSASLKTRKDVRHGCRAPDTTLVLHFLNREIIWTYRSHYWKCIVAWFFVNLHLSKSLGLAC